MPTKTSKVKTGKKHIPLFQLKSGVISHEEAMKISPEYVDFVLNNNFEHLDLILRKFDALKVGSKCLSYVEEQWVIGKITSKKDDWRALDGPLVRFGNGEYTWRVDGGSYAFPIVD